MGEEKGEGETSEESSPARIRTEATSIAVQEFELNDLSKRTKARVVGVMIRNGRRLGENSYNTILTASEGGGGAGTGS